MQPLQISFSAYVANTLVVALQLWFAHHERSLTVAQMTQRRQYLSVPLLWNSGMWSALVPYGLLFAYIVGNYANQWTLRAVCVRLVFGMAISAIIHWSYLRREFPEAYAWERKLTAVGLINLVYTGCTFATIGLFYFSSSGHTTQELALVWIVVMAHVAAATHVPLRLWKRFGNLRWFPYLTLLERRVVGVGFAVACFMSVFTAYAYYHGM